MHRGGAHPCQSIAADQIINMKHALVVLADKIDWAWLDDELAG